MLKSYYKHIWYLTKDPSIFDWTIYENLTYAIERKLENEELKKYSNYQNVILYTFMKNDYKQKSKKDE